MKISSKGRYAIAAMIYITEMSESQERVTVLTLSQKLGSSKVFMEQVFSLLRRSGLVISTKGSQGGYQLAYNPAEISVYDIMHATETGLFEPAEKTVEADAANIERVMQEMIFAPVDEKFQNHLKTIMLSDLAEAARNQSTDGAYMYYL